MVNEFGFQSVHPIVSFTYYVGVVLLVMLLFHPLFLLVALLAVIVLNVCHDRGRQLYRWRFMFLIVGVISLILNPLFNHRGSHILFYFLDQPITLEAVVYGAMTMLLLLCIFITFLSYNQVITSHKFLYLFSRVSPKVALMIMIAIRFVPLLKRRLSQITLVQRTRGVSMREGSIRKRLRDGMKQLQILVSWSLEEAIQTADSMNARGYTTGERTSYYTYRWNRRDIWILLMFCSAALGCIVGWFLGLGQFTIYPELGTINLTIADGVVFTCFILFLMTPLLVEGREIYRWRSWK